MPFPKSRLAQTPPRLTPVAGRASPKGSKNFGGLNKGIDMPNKSAGPAPDAAPMGGLPVRNFCKGGKVISTKSFS